VDSCLQELPLATGNFCVPAKLNYWYNFSTFVLQSSLLLLKFGMSDITKCYIICDGFHDSQNLWGSSNGTQHYLQLVNQESYWKTYIPTQEGQSYLFTD